MAGRSALPAPTDITMDDTILTGGVVERRIREEIVSHEQQVRVAEAAYQKTVTTLNSIFVARVRAIAADPFVKFDLPANTDDSDDGS